MARRTFPLHRRTTVCRNLFGPVDHEELSREMKDKMREISERDQQRWNFNFEANTPLVGDYEWEEVPVDTSPGFYQDSVQNERSKVAETPVTRRPSADSVLPEAPDMDVLERLAVPESSGAPCPGEVNQENRTDTLNSGRPAQRHVPCVRRKRAAATDNNTHITGKRTHDPFRNLPCALLAGLSVQSSLLCINCISSFPADFFVKRKRAADKKPNDTSACHLSKSPIPVEQTPRKRIR